MDPELLKVVGDIVRSPTAEDQYGNFKLLLIRRVGNTAEKKLQILLNELTPSDQRPSDLLRRMQELAGASLDKEAIKSQLYGHRGCRHLSNPF